MPDEFLAVAEVAELLKLNEQTIRNWIDACKLPATHAGNRRVRIARVDLDAFLDAGSSVPRGTSQLEPLRVPLTAALAAVNRDDAKALATALLELSHAAADLAKRLPA
jgi:excisionase family DNA binding protein